MANLISGQIRPEETTEKRRNRCIAIPVNLHLMQCKSSTDRIFSSIFIQAEKDSPAQVCILRAIVASPIVENRSENTDFFR